VSILHAQALAIGLWSEPRRPLWDVGGTGRDYYADARNRNAVLCEDLPYERTADPARRVSGRNKPA
jgi:hypothetical protein